MLGPWRRGKSYGKKKTKDAPGRHEAFTQREMTLEHLPEGEEALIDSVPNLPLLYPLGLRAGKRVRVRARGCLGGPVFAEVERRCVALGRRLAGEVKISPIPIDYEHEKAT